MKYFLLLLAIFLLLNGITATALAQQSKIDDLENALKKAKTDEERMEIYQCFFYFTYEK